MVLIGEGLAHMMVLAGYPRQLLPLIWLFQGVVVDHLRNVHAEAATLHVFETL